MHSSKCLSKKMRKYFCRPKTFLWKQLDVFSSCISKTCLVRCSFSWFLMMLYRWHLLVICCLKAQAPSTNYVSAKLSSWLTCKWSGLATVFPREGKCRKWKEIRRNEKKRNENNEQTVKRNEWREMKRHENKEQSEKKWQH